LTRQACVALRSLPDLACAKPITTSSQRRRFNIRVTNPKTFILLSVSISRAGSDEL
jgi:hypothetical protein